MKARIDLRREEGTPIRPAFFQKNNALNYMCVCGDHAVSLFDIDAHPREVGRLDGSSMGHFNDEILLPSQDVLAHVLATSEGIFVHQLVSSVCSFHVMPSSPSQQTRQSYCSPIISTKSVVHPVKGWTPVPFPVMES